MVVSTHPRRAPTTWETNQPVSMETEKKQDLQINDTKHNKGTLCKCLLLGFGIFLTSLGLALGIGWTTIFHFILESELRLSPQARYYPLWQNRTMPIFLDFYFFNLTNPKEMKDDGQKPIFQQLGPYRFRENKEKVGVEFHENKTVTYHQARYWFYDEKGTNGSYDDNVTTLNMVALSAAYIMRDQMYLVKLPVKVLLRRQELFITRPVRELLFEGYSDSMLGLAKSFQVFGGPVKYDKFGWFYKRNGSETFDGKFNVHTGEGDIHDLGKMGNWNDMTEIPHYESPCSAITGTSGDLWPPGMKRDRSLSFYSPELCRSVLLKYTRDVIVNQIGGYRYDLPKEFFDNGTLSTENKCTCIGECVPIGLLNVSACSKGAPIFVSLPHFYQADPYYVQSVQGLSPNKERHSFHMTFEPTTGVPLEGAARFQLTALLQPISGFRLFENVPRIFFPLLWFEQVVSMPENISSDLYFVLWLPIIGTVVGFVTCGIGLGLLASALWVIYKQPQNKLKTPSPNKKTLKDVSLTFGESEPLVHTKLIKPTTEITSTNTELGTK